MSLKITTWNINSVRLRIDLVAGFLRSAQPDMLCLQETKCPDDAFPLKRFKRLGYEHAAISGQKGYHGVAVLSRLPFEKVDVQSFCGKTDCRHVSVVLGERAGLRDPITMHNFYVPAGGDEPDPEVNPNSRTSSTSSTRCAHARLRPDRVAALPSWSAISTSRRSSTTSGVTSRCSRWFRTRRSNAKNLLAAQKSAAGSTRMRMLTPRTGKALHLVELSRDGQLAASDRGRRLDHVWTSDALADRVSTIKIAKELPRLASGRPTTYR